MITVTQQIGSFTLTKTEDLEAPWGINWGWWWAGTCHNFQQFGAGFHAGWNAWN